MHQGNSPGSCPPSTCQVAPCRYGAPDYRAIGEAYERLMEGVSGGASVDGVIAACTSWLDDVISDCNTDFYCQQRTTSTNAASLARDDNDKPKRA